MTPQSGVELLDLIAGASTPPTVTPIAVTDLQGNVLWSYNSGLTSQVNPVKLLPNGHFLVNFSGAAAADGMNSVLQEVDLSGNLDINRRPMSFPDWTHTNAILYSPNDGNLIVSIRHQHWLVKIDYNNGTGTGNILWHLGYQGDFTLVAGTAPPTAFTPSMGPRSPAQTQLENSPW